MFGRSLGMVMGRWCCGQFSEVLVVEAEPAKLLLVDRSHHFRVDGGQDWVLLGELRVEVARVFLVFLQIKHQRASIFCKWWRGHSNIKTFQIQTYFMCFSRETCMATGFGQKCFPSKTYFLHEMIFRLCSFTLENSIFRTWPLYVQHFTEKTLRGKTIDSY